MQNEKRKKLQHIVASLGGATLDVINKIANHQYYEYSRLFQDEDRFKPKRLVG
jgi:hypothetical protein